MIKKIILITIIIIVSYKVNALSVFSFYGPAEMLYQRDAYGEGMGGTGTGDMYRVNTNLINPALSATINRVYFSTAMTISNNYYTDVNEKENADSKFSLPYFTLVFPYKQNRFGFHYTNLCSTELKASRVTTFDETIGDVNSKEDVAFSLYRAGLFWTNRNVNLNFGVGVNYLFGSSSRSSSQSFLPGKDLTDSKITQDNRFQSPFFNIGVAKNMGNFSFGLAASYPMELNGDKTITSNAGKQEGGDSNFDYPATANMGVTFKLTDHFFLSTDLDYEMWGATDNFDHSIDVTRIGAGLSWAGIPLSKKFLAIFPCRVGVSYRNLPFKVNDSVVHEMAYHFGVSLPLRQYDSYMEVASKFYNRGNFITETGFSENGFLITVGLHGFDFFRRPPNRKMPRDIPKSFEERSAETGGRGSEGGGRRHEE